MAWTTDGEEPVRDPWGGCWHVRCRAVSVVPVPPTTPSPDAVAALFRPPHAAAAPPGAVRRPAAPPPAASWVLGRSARWHGPASPGAGDATDEVIAELSTVRPALYGGSVRLLLYGLLPRLVRGLGTLRRAPDDPPRRWLVELVDATGRPRRACWLGEGDAAAQATVRAVTEAVRAGQVPAPPARLVDVQDGPAGRSSRADAWAPTR